MKVRTVAVLRGGPSSEYEVSLKTGLGVIAALQQSGVTTKDIVISREGEWLLNGFMKKPEDTLYGVDVVFIALHGAYGEDGTVQRMLDRFAIPYTGSGPYASAIAMNKILTKEHLSKHGVRMPKHMRITRTGVTSPIKTAMSIESLFGPQYVIKPTSGGSSIGTQVAKNVHELGSMLELLLTDYDDLLVEERIIGTEATVGVLENYRGAPLYNMPAIEIVPPSDAGFFNTNVKYNGTTNEICPGRFLKPDKDALAQIAGLVHTTLGLRHYSRSDFIVAKDGVYFLEVNTLPGLTPESLFPKAIEAVGGNYNELITHLISEATGKKR